jgi:hypothetical protein
MGSEFDGLTVPVLGGVVDSEKHLVERRMRREGNLFSGKDNPAACSAAVSKGGREGRPVQGGTILHRVCLKGYSTSSSI